MLRSVKLLMGIFIFIFLQTSNAHSEECGTKNDNPRAVSLIKIITSPAEFDGKLIRVKGLLALENATAPELAYLYLSQADLNYDITENAIVINWSMTERKKAMSLDSKYVVIEGIFDKSVRGPWAFYAGGINCIRRVEKLPKFEELP
jgi:hypothetical protein